MVELGEIEMGMVTPLNLTFMVMVVALESGSISPFLLRVFSRGRACTRKEVNEHHNITN